MKPVAKKKPAPAKPSTAMKSKPKPKALVLPTELVDVDALKPHPKNYRVHTPEQLTHIVASTKEHGFYRNVVVAKDGTLLAGHGVIEAATALGLKQIPVVRLAVSPSSPQAMKVLAGDNEIARLGMVDDRLLTEILRDIATVDVGALVGTGFDQMMLANLVFTTRPHSEIADMNAAMEWVGLPGYDAEDPTKASEPIIEIQFSTAKDREAFVSTTGLKIRDKRGDRKWSTVWPYREQNDLKSVKFAVAK